ncbi:MAG: hypothetical protein ACFFDT_28530, partial [Candidatus Hodarchaeota archaeon]
LLHMIVRHSGVEKVINWEKMAINPLDIDSKRIERKHFMNLEQKTIYYCETCNIWFFYKSCRCCHKRLAKDKRAYLWLSYKSKYRS